MIDNAISALYLWWFERGRSWKEIADQWQKTAARWELMAENADTKAEACEAIIAKQNSLIREMQERQYRLRKWAEPAARQQFGLALEIIDILDGKGAAK